MTIAFSAGDAAYWGLAFFLVLLGLGSIFLESRLHNVFGAGIGADGTTSSTRLLPITAGFKITGP